MKNSFLLFILISTFTLHSFAQRYKSGSIYYGANEYIEYRAGNLPIIITAPHGGRLEPIAIPDRTCATCTTVMDANTMELSYQIDTALRQAFGCYPHIIINKLHRKKLDANREIVEAAQGKLSAEQAWREFHQYVQAAKDSIIKYYGRGLLLDIHGHGHTIQRLELGYLLTESELSLKDSILNTPQYANRLSIKNLAKSNMSGATPAQLLRGDFALGTLFEMEGFPAVPSKQQPQILTGELYFNGGYNTARHGSRDSTMIDAIQIEANSTGVRDNAANRKRFSEKLAVILRGYLGKHMFRSLSFTCATPVEHLDKLDIKIFPNPFVHKITIENPTSEVCQMTLVNEIGQVITNKRVNAYEITEWELADIPDGVYFLKIKNQTVKVFKVK